MTTNHIPGPWQYALNVGPTRALIVERDGSTVVEILNRTHDSRFEANARLIAAAPRLLAALKLMLDAQSSRRHPLGAPDEGIATICAEAASKASAAIAAAEGR